MDLLVRGICCLQPGVPGQSENIRVLSTVDRFLEHARIFFFEAGGKQEIYLSSADWMPRNFVRRVEVMFPIDDKALRDRVLDEILATQLADNVKAQRLLPDGSYQRVTAGKGAPPARSQESFIALAKKRAQANATPRAQEDPPSAGTVLALVNPVVAKVVGLEAMANQGLTPPPFLVS